MRSLLTLVFIMMISASASARVFQMGKESFAAYFKGNYGIANQGKETFELSGASGATYDSSYTSNMAYEFGFIYATPYVNWRFGFEILKPADLKEVVGTNAGGTTLYTLTDSISGYAPKIGLEINVKKWPKSRLFIGADYGLATITVQNSYTFTADGTAAHPGMTDFREEIQGTAPLIEAAVGFETLLSDTTTIAIDAGYRTLQVDEFTHKQEVTTFQGAVAKGDVAKNTDGTTRTLNMSGGFASIWLRFWIN